jgi:hypothetical protein
MQLRVQRQMVEDMKSISNLVFRFQVFSKLRRQVHGAESLISNRSLSKCDRLFDDYICDKLKQHSPNYALRRDYEELRDRSKLQVLCNKHNGHHLAQKVRVLKVELRGDMECEQI